MYSISYKCASKEPMKIWFSVGIEAITSNFDFQSCLPCANLDYNFLVLLSVNTADIKSNVTFFYWLN
jgi:hypothetical protein